MFLAQNCPVLTVNGLNPSIDLEAPLNPSANQPLGPPAPPAVNGGTLNPSDGAFCPSPSNLLSRSGPPNVCINKLGLHLLLFGPHLFVCSDFAFSVNLAFRKWVWLLWCFHIPQLVSDPVATTPSCNTNSPAPLQTSSVDCCTPSNSERHGSQSEL